MQLARNLEVVYVLNDLHHVNISGDCQFYALEIIKAIFWTAFKN